MHCTFVLIIPDFARRVWNAPCSAFTFLAFFLILGWSLDLAGGTEVDEELLESLGCGFGFDFCFKAKAGFGLHKLHVFRELTLFF